MQNAAAAAQSFSLLQPSLRRLACAPGRHSLSWQTPRGQGCLASGGGCLTTTQFPKHLCCGNLLPMNLQRQEWIERRGQFGSRGSDANSVPGSEPGMLPPVAVPVELKISGPGTAPALQSTSILIPNKGPAPKKRKTGTKREMKKKVEEAKRPKGKRRVGEKKQSTTFAQRSGRLARMVMDVSRKVVDRPGGSQQTPSDLVATLALYSFRATAARSTSPLSNEQPKDNSPERSFIGMEDSIVDEETGQLESIWGLHQVQAPRRAVPRALEAVKN